MVVFDILKFEMALKIKEKLCDVTIRHYDILVDQLSSFVFFSGKYLVLFFYPLDFTFVCPTEIIAFSDRAQEFRAINCEVLACSVDSHFSHLAW